MFKHLAPKEGLALGGKRNLKKRPWPGRQDSPSPAAEGHTGPKIREYIPSLDVVTLDITQVCENEGGLSGDKLRSCKTRMSPSEDR